MNNEKDFYNILRSKFNQGEQPFDEANWNSMKAIITKSRAARKRSLWFIASAGVLLCTGIAFGVYKWTSTAPTITVASFNTPNTPTSQPKIENTPSVNNASKSVANSVSAQTNNPTHSETLNNAALATTDKRPSNINTAIIEASLKHTESAKNTAYAKAESQSIAAHNSVASVDESKINKESTTANPVTGKITGPSLAPSTVKEGTKTSPLIAPKTVLVSKTTVKGKSPDSAKASDIPPRFSDEPRIFMGKTNIYSIEIGTEWATGWAYGPTTQGHGLNPILGASYTHYLKSKLFLKTGLQFSTYENMSSYTYNYQHSVNQGNNTLIYDSVITTRRLYYVSVPIQLEYYVGHKISIGGGATITYLLGSSGYATTYNQYDNSPPQNVKEYSQNIQLSGYTKFNADLHLFGKWVLNEHYSLYIVYYNGLTDMKNNAFFGENLIERNKGLQLIASYSF